MLNHLDVGVFYGVREMQFTSPVRRFAHVRLHSESKLRPFTTSLRQ